MKTLTIIGPSDEEIEQMQKENEEIKIAVCNYMKENNKFSWERAWDIIVDRDNRKVKKCYEHYIK